MAEATKTSIIDAAERLASLLKTCPDDARRTKALYQLERLQLAVNASHQEGVRFAAFTISKTVHDASDWDAAVASAMETLRTELRAHGHEF